MTKEERDLVNRTNAEIQALEATIRDKQKSIRDKQAAMLGEHKVVYELEPIFKDVGKGGEPYTKVRKEYYRDEGKCIWCGWDGREAAGLPEHPIKLGQEEFLLLQKTLEAHQEKNFYPTRDFQGHAGVMRVTEIGTIPAGNNPDKIVAVVNGERITAADWNAKEKEHQQILNDAARGGREIPIA